MTDTQLRRDPPTVLLGVLAGAAVGFAAQGAMPLLLGAVIDGLQVNEAAAGLLASLEIGVVAVTSLLLAPRIHRIRRRRLAFVGTLVACAGQALSIAAPSYEALLGARLIAGLGEGAAFATANAALAGALQTERLTAWMAVIGGAGAGMLLGLLPYVVEPYGYAGGFGVLLVIGVACLPFLRFLPDAPDAALSRPHGPGAHPVLGAGLMLAFFALALGGSAMWAFTERIGLAVGLSPESTGAVLGVAMVAGLGGAVAAGWLDVRAGRALPLVVGLCGVAAATLLVGGAVNTWAYAGGLVLWTAAFLFVMPYLMGTAAELDKQGRWAAASVGFWSVGSALGPASAGVLVARLSYASLGALAGGAALLALALVLPVAIAVGRERSQPSEA